MAPVFAEEMRAGSFFEVHSVRSGAVQASHRLSEQAHGPSMDSDIYRGNGGLNVLHFAVLHSPQQLGAADARLDVSSHGWICAGL